MSQNFKVDRINAAYSKLRISGVTVDPTPEDLELALQELENMMSEINISIGYNFEDEPDPNSPLGVDRKYWNMINTNLAIRLIADFNKAVPGALVAQANQSMSAAVGYAAADRVRQVQYPSRMPSGSGNTNRFGRWYRFAHPVQLPPNDKETVIIEPGDVDDYRIDFSAYLEDEVIASYLIEATNGLTIDSSSNDSPVINYRVTVADGAQVWQQVKVTITTDLGRVQYQTVNFEVKT
jgi:hypothetical protein